jgi:hypothetical protein
MIVSVLIRVYENFENLVGVTAFSTQFDRRGHTIENKQREKLLKVDKNFPS